MKKTAFRTVCAAVTLMTVAPAALAHASDLEGVWHLLTGIDHLLLLVAIAAVARLTAQRFGLRR